MNILVIDVGGTHVKVWAIGHEVVKIPSGPKMTPTDMVAAVREVTEDWVFDAISVGYPGVVIHGRPIIEPRHLGAGWVGFAFKEAFDRPVKIVNDAKLAHLPYKKGRSYEDYLGLAGLKWLGKRKWRRQVKRAVKHLRNAMQAEYVVIGGGNAKLLKKAPLNAELGDNSNAFKGGERLWSKQYNARHKIDSSANLRRS